MTEAQSPFGFIYITTNLVDWKRYVGQRRFFGNWAGYMGSGIHLKRAIAKYGKDNFVRDIVDLAYSQEELNQKEIQWISDLDATSSKEFYNIAGGGHKNNMEGLSDQGLLEWKQKLSVSHVGIHTGENHPMYGKKHTEEARKRISEGRAGKPSHQKGKPLSDEQKQKISEANKGRVPPNKGKSMPEHLRRQMSESRKGVGPSMDVVLKTSKHVTQLTLDGEPINQFYSISEAERQTKIDRRLISKCCEGLRDNAGGYKWALSVARTNQAS